MNLIKVGRRVGAQTALYPRRLTTVAWPGPACQGATT